MQKCYGPNWSDGRVRRQYPLQKSYARGMDLFPFRVARQEIGGPVAHDDAPSHGAGKGAVGDPARLPSARRPNHRGYTVPEGHTLREQRLDETGIGEGTTVTLTDAKRPAIGRDREPGTRPLISGCSRAAGLVRWDVFDAVLTPGDLILLMSWRTHEDAERVGGGVKLPADARLRRVRVVRDYGMFDRREAPQYYPEARRSEPSASAAPPRFDQSRRVALRRPADGVTRLIGILVSVAMLGAALSSVVRPAFGQAQRPCKVVDCRDPL